MKKITPLTKIGYGFGAFGKDMVYSYVATFIMFYFTDISGINPAFLGVMFLIARIWDAFNDPMMGMIVDSTRSRFGKFRPWLAIGTMVNAIILCLLFFRPGTGSALLYIAATALYILWGMTYTIMDIPYWSMIPALSQDQKQRENLSVIARVCASLGFFLVATVGLPIANFLGSVTEKELADGSLQKIIGDPLLPGVFPSLTGQARGFFFLAVIIASAFILTLSFTVFTVKEKPTDKKKSVPIKEMFRILFANDQALVVMLVMIVFNTVIYLTTGLGLYFFKYNLGRELLFSQFTIVAGVSQVASMLLYPLLSKFLKRKKIFSLSVFVPIAGYLLLIAVSFIPGSNFIFLLAAGVVLFFGLGVSQVISTVMLAETVDYGEWKTGKRNEGIIFSLQPLVVKTSSGISAFIIGIGLSLFGFIPNQVQQPLTLLGIQIMMFIIPIAGLVLSFLLYRKFYKINETFYDTISKELKGKEDTV